MKRTIIAVLSLLIFASAALAATVYITDTGDKYHQASCQYLSKSRNPISQEQAIAQGYSPCSVCISGSSSTTPRSSDTKKPASTFQAPKKELPPYLAGGNRRPVNTGKNFLCEGKCVVIQKGKQTLAKMNFRSLAQAQHAVAMLNRPYETF